MKPELIEQICRLATDPALKAMIGVLKEESTKKMLAAKTSEERDGHWRDYHAAAGLEVRLGRMAAEAKAQAGKP